MTQSAEFQPGIRPDATAERPLGELVSDLWQNSETLVRQEFSLALTEVDQRIDEAKSGLRNASVGGSVLYAGVLAVVAAVILLLAEVMPAWLSAALVGIVAIGVGFALLQSGKRRLTPDKPTLERTVPNVRRDVKTFKEAVR